MKKVVLLFLAALLLVPAAGIAKKKEYNLTGTYKISGYNPGAATSGEPSYTGKLTITESGGAYLLNWKLGDKKTDHSSVGIYSDGILSAGYNGGVASYKVEEKGLKGVWVPAGGGLFGFEYGEKE